MGENFVKSMGENRLLKKVWVKTDGSKSLGANFVKVMGEKSIGVNLVKSMGEKDE